MIAMGTEGITALPTAIRVQTRGVPAGIKLLVLAFNPALEICSSVSQIAPAFSGKSLTEAQGMSPFQ
ncbi:hypothetical protein CNECB9_1470014 [Cupriavidus necator]|uniref:Uncharacterized protein n=1 Tax=Cupriavidus necator TaxID=106590 RepID=A0A1K0I9Q6_CUPNE|nr:hypothetical protein CNECB9_1470014 [Cupriavidus necator]